MKKMLTKGLAALLCFVLVTAIAPIPALAEGAEAQTYTSGEVTAFAPLAEDVAEQSVQAAEGAAAPALPPSLVATATVTPPAGPTEETEPGSTPEPISAEVDVPVQEWVSSPAFDAALPGSYSFAPVLQDGWTLAEGVEVPTITVTVSQPPKTGEEEPGDGEPAPEAKTITAFAPLDTGVWFQEVSAGAKKADMNLPSELTATIDGAGQTVSGVTWECAAYSDEAGMTELEYEWKAVLPEGYALADGVEPPSIFALVDGGGTIMALADGVPYVDPTDPSNPNKTANGVTELSSDWTDWDDGWWDDGWYVVSHSLTISSRIVVDHDTKLILTDGAVLSTTKGITVYSGGRLTIYGQTNGTGKLVAGTSNQPISAGIGGGSNDLVGTITINGGIIEATGGSDGGAGIGGGHSDSDGFITINGGTVTATGGSGGAGIGGGHSNKIGAITINGGTVTAIGGSDGAGIGGGVNSMGGTFTVNGGMVTATGGSGGAGIGGGVNGVGGDSVIIRGGTVIATGDSGGAGIGGGSGGNVAIIGISGGTVTANGGVNGGAGIGGSNGGNILEIGISGGTVTANGGSSGAGIGSGIYGTDGRNGTGGTIDISGSADATAQGGAGIGSGGGGAGIGSGGAATATFKITITTTGTVNAIGGAGGADGGRPGQNIGKGGGGAGMDYVPYLDENGIQQYCFEYTAVTNKTTQTTWSSGWYVVNSTVSISGSIVVSGNVNLILTDGAHLNASRGIPVIGTNSLTIYAQSGGTGKLTVTTVGYSGAGIGGVVESANAGTITIIGGIINAAGGARSAGIGGGYDGAGGNITILGGTVTATGGVNGGAGIGGGSRDVSGTIIIAGSANVTAQGGACGSDDFRSYHGGAGIGSGGAANHDPAGDYDITITTTGTVSAAGGAGNGSNLNPGARIGKGGSSSGLVDEVELGDANIDMSLSAPPAMGPCWTYAENVYTLLSGANVTVTGTSANNRRLAVAENAKNVQITLDNAHIAVPAYALSPLLLNSGAKVDLVLADGSINTLTATLSCAGIQTTGAVLTISGDTGNLTATGGAFGAGIGGGYQGAGGNITITGGAVTATGGASGAGIGGGYQGAGGTIVINGGTVTATGGASGAGIGGGYQGVGGTFAMDGDALVYASSVSDATAKDNGILFAGGNGTVYGEAALREDLGIESGQTLTVGNNAKLTIPSGITLDNNGTVTVYGTIENNGTFSLPVIWNANGGNPAPMQDVVNYGRSDASGTIEEPSNAMSRDGCTFAGWYIDAGFSSAATFPIQNVTNTAGVAFHARWTREGAPSATAVSANAAAPLVGTPLTGSYIYNAGTGAGAGADASTFQWYRSAANTWDGTAQAIVGATNKTYTPTGADVGKYLYFEVTPTNGATSGDKVQSAASGQTGIIVSLTVAANGTTGTATIGGGTVPVKVVSTTPPTLLATLGNAASVAWTVSTGGGSFTNVAAADPGYSLPAMDASVIAPISITATFSLTPAPVKTVSVGAQSGMLTAGTAGTVTFPVTTANIGNGSYTVSVANLPTGVSVSGQVTISGNTGTLTLAGNTSTAAGTTGTLTLTIDGATSAAFTLTIGPAAPVKTVSAGTQSGTLTAGTSGTVTFPVTTANITDGSYTVSVANLPTGVTVSGQVTIKNNAGTLTLAGNTSTAAGMTGLTLTIDGATSGSFSLYISSPGSIPVTSITVTGAGNATTITTDGGTLQMSATVLPANATNKTVTWSVTPGTGNASISVGGLLTAKDNGSVTIRATANDGTGEYGEVTIDISGQTLPVSTIRDAGSGVSVKGRFAPGATIAVTQNSLLHTAGSCAACDEIRGHQQSDNLLALYEISVLGSYEGALEVSIPVGAGYNGQALTVLHCANGTCERLTFTVANGNAVGTVTGLSPFAVLKPAGGSDGGGANDSAAAAAQRGSAPQTGDNSNFGLWFSLGALALAGLGGLLVWRRKARKPKQAK